MSPQGQKFHRAREAAEAAGIVFTERPLPLETVEAQTYWTAFSLLSRTRLSSESGPQPIVLRELACYLDEERITNLDHRDDVIYFVKVLDDKYLEIVAANLKRERDKATSGKGRRRGRRR